MASTGNQDGPGKQEAGPTPRKAGSGNLIIALDAMGGDKAPDMVLDGAMLARERFPSVRFLLFGDAEVLEAALKSRPRLAEMATIMPAEDVVSNDDKPSTALRKRRKSSMRLAIDAVRDGSAAGVVSAGNTGALMAMAKLVLGMLPGVDRPAIASFFPTQRGESCMLDLGANIVCQAENLVQFAIMGNAFARSVLGIKSPTVGLLNVGAEELKGNDQVREAAAFLKASNLGLDFRGFVEGDDIGAGTVDVIVTDGFSGNIALKTAEGIAKLYTEYLRRAFGSSLMAKIGYLLARGAMQRVRQRIDPRRYNGAMLLGLNGIVVKSHGGTDDFGFANAVGAAVDLVSQDYQSQIRREIELMGLGKSDKESPGATPEDAAPKAVRG